MNAKLISNRLIEERSSIKQYLTANNPLFNQKMKKIMAKDFKTVEEIGIYEKRNNPTPNIFFFNAERYDSDLKDDIEEYIVKLTNNFLLSNDKNSYAVAYVHSSIFDFIAFRRMLERWPEHFFEKLRRVYIVGPSLIVKLLQTCSMGTFYRFCDQIFLNIDAVEEITVADTELLKNIGEQQKQQTIFQFKNAIKIISNQIYGKQLTEYELHSGRYPTIVISLLKRLMKNPNQLKKEGIFRISCNCQQLERLERKVIRKDTQAIDSETDVLIVVGFLKKFFNNLKVPLFNYKIYNKILQHKPLISDNKQVNQENEKKLTKSVFEQMEQVNKCVYFLLLVFLKNYIIAQVQNNKMNAYNLSVILGPCFFRPKDFIRLEDLSNAGKFVKFIMISLQKEVISAQQIQLAIQALKSIKQN